MTFDGKSRLLISLVLASLITGALINHWKRVARQKKESSTYEKVLLVLEETNTALMQVGPHSTKIYAPNSIACSMFGYTFSEMDGSVWAPCWNEISLSPVIATEPSAL